MNASVRPLPLLVTLASCTYFVGCMVPAKQYDAALANANAQHEALVTLQTEIDQCEERRVKARERLAAAEAETRVLANDRSGLELDLTVARRERDDAQLLVDQLRGELERVGRDVRTFAGRNAQLQDSLGQLESRVQDLAAAERAAEARTKAFSELALGLRDDLAKGVVDLELVGGRPVILLLGPAVHTGGLSDKGEAAVRVVGRVIAASATGRVEIRVSPSAEQTLADTVARALNAGGLAPARTTIGGPLGRGGTPLVQLVVELAPAPPVEEPR